MTTLRVSIANVTPELAAAHFQAAGLSGSVAPCVGFGAWGVEPGVVVTFGGLTPCAHHSTQTHHHKGGQCPGNVRATVRDWLAELGEECAWIEDDSEGGRLLYADGRDA